MQPLINFTKIFFLERSQLEMMRFINIIKNVVTFYAVYDFVDVISIA